MDERSVSSLRKIIFIVMLVLMTALCASAMAKTEYSLAPAPAEVSIPDPGDNRAWAFVVNADTLGDHPELLTVLGSSKEEILADWEARSVLFQAWRNVSGKTPECLEVSVVQDENAAQYPDLIHTTDKAVWKAYKESYISGESWSALGYRFRSYDQKTAEGKQYILLKYTRSAASGNYRGYMARTVFGGYTLVFDIRAYNHDVTEERAKDLYYIVNSLREGTASGEAAAAPEASPAAETPADASIGGSPETAEAVATPVPEVPLEVSVEPPLETNTNTFTVEGVTGPGLHVIGVLMRINSADSLRFETDAHARTGVFKLKVTIPADEENVWLMTLNVLEGEKVVADKVFNTTTYRKTLIPVTLDEPVPETVYADELVIKGTTMKGPQVQCLVTDSSAKTIFDKTVQPNGTGRFTFKIPMKEEDQYGITLVFNKKGYESKRFSYTVSRFLTDEARQALIRKQAQNIGYGALTARIDQYVGKMLKFNVWILSIEQVGDEWHILAAGAKTGENHYTQKMRFISEQEPSFAVEEKHLLYGNCIGPFTVESEEGVEESIPSLDLLFWD